MKEMNIRGHVVFKKGDKVFSVNRMREGYIISPLTESGTEYIAVRFDDRRVFLYRVPEDIADNIYPLHIYDALRKKHMAVDVMPLIKSRYDPQRLYIRIEAVAYEYTGTVRINPPAPEQPIIRAVPGMDPLDEVDQDILDIFDEAQSFTGKSDLHLEMYSPVSDYLDYIGDMD